MLELHTCNSSPYHKTASSLEQIRYATLNYSVGSSVAHVRLQVCLSSDRAITMDVFGDALDDPWAACTAPQSVSKMAPSQDTLFDSTPRRASPTITVIDDDEHVSPESSTEGSQPSATYVLADAVSSPKSDAVTPSLSKRRRVTTKVPQFTPVPSGDAMEVMCVFVPSGKKLIPVALWTQYTVTWDATSLGDSRWLMFSNYERWLMELVDVATNRPIRAVAKNFMDRFRQEFLVALNKARVPEKLEDAFALRDDSEHINTNTDDMGAQPLPGRWRNRKFTPELLVNIGGFDMITVNDAKKIVMKIDVNLVKFIYAWVVPLVRDMARSQDKQESETMQSPEAPSNLARFHFEASSTPNIRDKVVWNPMDHKWKVLLKKPLHSPELLHCPDPDLDPQSYEFAKLTAYGEAILEWNRCDGSTRHRIPVPCQTKDNGQ